MERKGLACFLFLALAGQGVFCAAEEATLLQVNAPIDRDLNGGESHLYRLKLEAGDYARVEIEQLGIDVKTVLRDPSGSELATVDSRSGRFSTETVSMVAEMPGEHSIRVQPFFGKTSGRYRVTLTAHRPADRTDRLRVEAERADLAVEALQLQGGPENPELAGLAVERWRELGDRRSEASALTRLANSQRSSGLREEVFSTYDSALAIQRSLGDKEGIAETLMQAGGSSRLLGNRDRALSSYEECIGLWDELGRPDRVSKALVELGKAYKDFGETDAALASYSRALDLARKIADPFREADALNELGQLHIRLGQPRKALDELRAALDLAQAVENRSLETNLRTNLGTLYRDSSPYKALEQFAAAARIFHDTGQPERECAALNNLGGLLLGLGAPEDAKELYLRALPLSRDPRVQANTLLGIARAEDQLGNLQEAEARLDAAQQLQQSVAYRPGEAETLRIRGFLFLKMGKPAEARGAFVQALGLMEQLGGQSTQVSARRGLARAEADLGNAELARTGFEEARKKAEEVGNVSEQVLALAEAGRLEHEAGRLPEARARLESALQLVESFQAEIGGESLRAQHFAKVRETYERYVDVLMQIHRAKPDDGLLAAAFEVAEHSRARSLLDVLTRARVDTRDGDPALGERELQLRLELNAKATSRMTLPPGPEREAVDREIQALSADYQVVKARLAGRYLELTQPSIRVPDIQSLLDDGTVLLEYLLGDVRSYLWVVSRDSLTSYELPARSQVEEMARQLHDLLSNPSERDASLQRQALDRLSRTVIAPAIEGLAGKRLIIVADGALQYVPFAALPINVSNPAPAMPTTQALLAEHETVLLPSAAVLREIRRASAARPASTPSLAILANPSYGQAEPTPPAPLPLVPEVTRGSLAPLTWSEQEAKRIASLAEGYEVLTALGPDATRELAMSGRLSHYRLLHFATHGYLDSDHPELSGLALASVDKDGHALEGFLRLQDLYSLHLQSDLVVLSGCETGLGKDRRGEGLQSLTHGFLHAGASQVIASLWPVRDRAATELMLRLYQAMLRDGKRPSAALREAQLGMLSQRTWKDPYFWAAFVAQGDWLAGPDTADRLDTRSTR